MYPNAVLTSVERVFKHGKRDARSETKAVAVPRSRWPSIHGGQCFKIVSACYLQRSASARTFETISQKGSMYVRNYEIYSPRMLPIFVNALFRPLARVVIPAVAAKATSAMINRYSTSPWPVSSFCKWFREFRIRVFMLVFLLNNICLLIPSAGGGRDGWAHLTHSG